MQSIPTDEIYYRQSLGRMIELVFDHDHVDLDDIVTLATLEFDRIDFSDLLFPVPDGFGNYYDRYRSPIVLQLRSRDIFIEHEDSFECPVPSVITLADVIKYAHVKTKDLSRVKVGWLGGQMFLSVSKQNLPAFGRVFLLVLPTA